MRRVGLVVSFLFVFGSAVIGQPVEDRLLAHLANIEKWSNYGNTPNERRLESANNGFATDLLRFGRSSEVLSYSFPRLKRKMHVATSADGNFRIYSWDAGTGGTMHDFSSMFQFRGTSGKVYASSAHVDGFIHDIFQVNSPAGPIYLAVSTSIASGTMNSQSIKAFKIKGDIVDEHVRVIRTAEGLQNSISFGYDFGSVMDRKERPVRLFAFNETDRSFSFPVVIEDEETPQGRVTNKLITYKFDGEYFVKVD